MLAKLKKIWLPVMEEKMLAYAFESSFDTWVATIIPVSGSFRDPGIPPR
jgi:hypothetical protein